MEYKNILIVEDTDGVRQLLHKVVKSFSPFYRVTSLENGKLAQEELLKNKYNLIISDIQMPMCSGVELFILGKKE